MAMSPAMVALKCLGVWNYITSKLFAEGSAVAQNRCSAVAQNRCSAEMYTDCAVMHIAGALYMYTEVQYSEIPTAGLVQ